MNKNPYKAHLDSDEDEVDEQPCNPPGFGLPEGCELTPFQIWQMREAGNAEYIPKQYVKDTDTYNRTDQAVPAKKTIRAKPIDRKAVANFIQLAN